VVIHDFHVVSIGIFPFEADAPLLIDADAELAGPVAAQRFETVAGQARQILHGFGVVQDFQPSFGLRGTGFEFPDALALEKCFRIRVMNIYNNTILYISSLP
jgi:hypothetical protein